ncbi:hypothetical protein EC988_007991, partial [Linderina pennispora]
REVLPAHVGAAYCASALPRRPLPAHPPRVLQAVSTNPPAATAANTAPAATDCTASTV